MSAPRADGSVWIDHVATRPPDEMLDGLEVRETTKGIRVRVTDSTATLARAVVSWLVGEVERGASLPGPGGARPRPRDADRRSLSGVNLPRLVCLRLSEAHVLCALGTCRGDNAANSDGRAVFPTDPAAVSWDPAGALFRVAADDDGLVLDVAARMLAGETAGDPHAPSGAVFTHLHRWSDGASRVEALSAFARAMARCTGSSRRDQGGMDPAFEDALASHRARMDELSDDAAEAAA